MQLLERRRFAVALVLALLAFAIRVHALDAAGLAEDETNKIFAVRAYEQGDFTVNQEHPMLMKMLCYASLHLAESWNGGVGVSSRWSIPEETALRLPNVLFGSLTTIPILLLATSLLNFRTGLLAALLWATGLSAIWFNRIAKEDTLLVFFLMTAFYLYNQAKRRSAGDVAGQERLYAMAGFSFGLMLCSKYFPHYFGLNALFYYLVGTDSRDNRPLSRQMLLKYFGATLLGFVLFNPAFFTPQSWRYIVAFVSENLVTHHGFDVMGQLWPNKAGQTPTGSPWYFYFLVLGVKVPLPLLVAFVAGLIEIFRRRGKYPSSRGYLFLRMMLFFWLFPMTFGGAKFARYTLQLMPVFYITAAVGIVQIWRLAGRALTAVLPVRPARLAATCAALALFLAAPLISTLRSLPYPSLYLNVLGDHQAGYYFPHDEFYDLGARESVRYLATIAPAGATVASEVPGIVEYYLERYGRTDVRSEIMSHPKFTLMGDRPDFVLLQRGRRYFENADNYALIQRNLEAVQTSDYFGVQASSLYDLRGRWDIIRTRDNAGPTVSWRLAPDTNLTKSP